MKCDYCNKPGVELVGEANGVVVCVDHSPGREPSEKQRRAVGGVLRVIQKTADAQGNVTMLQLAENIARDAALVRLAQAEGWDGAITEAVDRGLLNDAFADEMYGRNPYRAES